jgi:hypothetical protein
LLGIVLVSASFLQLFEFVLLLRREQGSNI